MDFSGNRVSPVVTTLMSCVTPLH